MEEIFSHPLARRFVRGVLIATLFVTCSATAEAQGEATAKQRTAKEFKPEVAAQTYDFFFYDYIECVGRNGYVGVCTGWNPPLIPMDAPSGWQICRPIFTRERQDVGSYMDFGPSRWSTFDPATPVSFGRFTITVSVNNDGIRYTNIGIRLIRADAGYATRFAEGCEFLSPPTW